MPEPCSILTCYRRSQGICNGCRKHFCSEHRTEHDLSIQSEINPLTERMRGLDDRLRRVNKENLLISSLEELENWRLQAHQMVDVYHASKVQQLDDFFTRRIQECNDDSHRIQSELTRHKKVEGITHEQLNMLNADVEVLQQRLVNMEENEFKVSIDRLNLDENLIRFAHEFNLSTISAAYRSISRNPTSSPCLASDGKYLLLHRNDRLVFVDDQMNQFESIRWTHDPIVDMCYSTTLFSFIILTAHEVYLLEQKNLTVNKVRSIPWQEWCACTCSRSTLYLTTAVYSSSLMEFSFSPSIHFVKRWQTSELGENNDTIDDIDYKHRTIALLISNDLMKKIRVDLRSAPVMELIWSLPLYLIYNSNELYRLCSIGNNDWLVANHTEEQVLHISNDGKFVSSNLYRPTPYGLLEFGENTLAVSTSKAVYLHKF